jgi:hypothetical protein
MSESSHGGAEGPKEDLVVKLVSVRGSLQTKSNELKTIAID